MKKSAMIAALLLLLAASGVWYVRGQTVTLKNESPRSIMPQEDTGEKRAAGVEAQTSEVVIEGTEFKFLPTTLTFKKGETVKLVFKNTGKMPHDWVIDELNVRTKIINGGETDTIEFTPQLTGAFEYYCSVGAHRANGMKGTFIVE